MRFYRTIDAWQWVGKTSTDAKKFCEKNGLPQWDIGINNLGETGLKIEQEGFMPYLVLYGEMLIRYEDGTYSYCSFDEFWEYWKILDNIDLPILNEKYTLQWSKNIS